MAHTTLIQSDELAALLAGAPDQTVVCDCRFDLADPHAGRRAYQAGHIPGAVHLDLDTMLSGRKTGANGRHPLPDRDAFAALMAELGVDNSTQIVAYDAGDGMYAARLWAMMRWIGHSAVAVLDGGMAAWTGTVATQAPDPLPPGDLSARPALLRTVDYAAVRAASASGSHIIVDARAPDRFRGENETLDKVGGHIPGAVNRFFRANLTDGRFKPADALRDEFATLLGDRSAPEVIAQCGSGVTACHNLLAMELAGLPGAALYPGSWSEWSSRPDAPMARRAVLGAVAALLAVGSPARAEEVTVLAAASLTDALRAVGKAWEARGHAAPKFAFAASSTLARQIEEGAPADIFVSADEQWADTLQKQSLLQPASRTNLLGNELVLVAPAGRADAVALTGEALLARLGADGKLAVGDPAGVPAGIYARQALSKLGLWETLQPRLAKADSVRSALLLVSRGEAPLGIVYSTDAAITHDVRVVATFPSDSHDPVVYPFALTARGISAEARAFFTFLTGPEATPIYRSYGFLVRE